MPLQSNPHYPDGMTAPSQAGQARLMFNWSPMARRLLLTNWGFDSRRHWSEIPKSQAMKYEDGAMEGFSRRSARAAYDINDYGDVVGTVETNAPRPHAFLFSDNNLLDLGTLDGDMISLRSCGVLSFLTPGIGGCGSPPSVMR